MMVHGHFVEGAQAEARAMGIRSRGVSVDRIGDPAYAAEVLEWCAGGWTNRFMLFIYLTEERIRNAYHAWDAMVTPIRWLRDRGLAGQCAGIQLGDEVWDGLYTGALGRGPHWPSLAGHPDPWSLRVALAHELGHRAADLEAYWSNEIGTVCPPIGTAISGGCAPPAFARQDWWSLNVYLQPPHYLTTPEAVWRVYRAAWRATDLRIMPTLPFFGERGVAPPHWFTLAHTYCAPFELSGVRYPAIIDHPQTWHVGAFCVRHPSADDAVHGDGVGLTRLDPSYAEGVRWLATHLQAR